MDAATAKFLVMMAVIVGSSAAGYFARTRGVMREELAKPLTFWIMVLAYPFAGALPVWVLPLGWSDIWVVVQPVILMLAGLGAGWVVARRLKLPLKTAGVFAYTASLSNIGFTMGGFICLRLYGERGLAYALVYILLWTVVFFGVFFPLAGRFAGRAERYTAGTFVRNLVDLRCLPLLGILVGIVLNLAGVERPTVVDRLHLVDVLVIVCTAVMFFVTGLRLHISHLLDNTRLYMWLGAIKFVMVPALAVGLLWLVRGLGMNVGEMAGNVMIVESTMPAALFGVVVANLYDLDAPLASALFVGNTLMFLAVVLPIVLLVMG